jgi:hypothetical protein
MKNSTLLFIFMSHMMCFGQSFSAAVATTNEQNKTLGLFEENKGQVRDQNQQPRADVMYYGSMDGMHYYLRNKGISYQLSRVESWKEADDHPREAHIGKDEAQKEKRKVPKEISIYRVDAEWVNSSPSFRVLRGKEQEGYSNYYNVPEGVAPALYVKKYEAITMQEVWEGIDVHYYGSGGLLETDYLVSPGADYRHIQIAIKGAELEISKKGTLLMRTPFGEIQEGELKVYQNKQRIPAYWRIDKHNRVSFEIPYHNPALPITIDPLTRVWGTYYGGG